MSFGTNIDLTLIELLTRRATENPTQSLYTFATGGETAEEQLTYYQLHCRAISIASVLRTYADPGARALLLFPPGLAYISAFFGCLYAGIIAVPAYPPHLNRPSPRLRALIADAGATLALTTEALYGDMGRLLTHEPTLQALQWVATDTLPIQSPHGWQTPSLPTNHLAFLQYTSGSTGTPKGVMLTHGNLLANLALIQQAFGTHRESRGVIWLPPYHDMGLIGGILQPLYGDFPVYLMPPVAFLQRPISWLEAISKFRATASGGPNFAYDICIQKTTPEQREGLDLSSWEVAFNGAEPIRANTLAQFSETFAPYGFRAKAFYPCYGLAESTLLVAGGDFTASPIIATFESEALVQREARPANADGLVKNQTLISSGSAFTDHQIVIADPYTGSACADGEIGEIWVAGDSVAQGYWQRPEESRATFRATLPNTQGPHFLRTGDLGFLQQGELFVTGRLKELLIIRGRNHYPQDIELTIEQSHSAFRPGCGAAFTVPIEGEERLVVVYEVDRHALRTLDGATVAQQARQAVAQQHEVQLYELVLIRTATLPKTSSGKIQRRACRDQYLNHELTVLYRHALGQTAEASTEPAATTPVSAASNFIIQALNAVSDTTTHQTLVALYLQEQLARRLRLPAAEVPQDRPIAALGVDSLMVVDVAHHIATIFGVELPLALFLDDVTLQDVAQRIVAGQGTETTRAIVPHTETPATFRATSGQQALWFLQQIAPDSTAYHIVCALKTKTQLYLPNFVDALTRLLERHPGLRAQFAVEAGETVQRIGPALPDFAVIPAHGWNDAHVQQHGAEEAHRPFNLQNDALLRVRVYERNGDDDVIVMVAHHIVTDLWSLTVMLQELGSQYEAIRTQQPISLPTLTYGFHDFVAHQQAFVTSAAGVEALHYWRTQLSDGHLPVLALPFDRPRPPLQSYRGATHKITLDADVSAQLRAFSRTQGVTLYMTLLALYTLVLHQYSGQEDVVVGSPTTGRADSAWSHLVGYCINPIAIRSQIANDPTVADFVQHIRRTVLAGLTHQEYPFALLTKQLSGTGRDTSYSPIFQTMFMFQQAVDPALSEVLALALNLPGNAFRVGGLLLEPLPIEQQSAQFDLTLMMAEGSSGLRALFQYNSDLFDAATIARFATHFQEAARHFVRMATEPLSQVPLLPTSERQLLLETWNHTTHPYQASTIDALFAEQVARIPDATALVFEGTALSFGELNCRANQLAHHLRALGVGPDVRVGVCMHRSIEMMVALLGVLKAGGAYVPLDPTYPTERVAFVLDDAAITILLTQPPLVPRFKTFTGHLLPLTAENSAVAAYPTHDPAPVGTAERLAYMIYTSGSTGKPKGVMVPHRAVTNFFIGMDEKVGCSQEDTLLAVTSISFDISVLELFWTLTRGAKVVLLAEDAATRAPVTSNTLETPVKRDLGFSLFYFAADEGEGKGNKYQLLLEGAKFADQHGFEAIWTPERHFHAFGGLYPNPAITSAAVAAITERVKIRAGSVVLPLHSPIRVAEDWSVIDNISNGRVGIAFASGWHANDFVFFPQNYETRREVTLEGIETVRRLWRGETISAIGGVQQEVAVRILPRPIQPELPIWVTAAGNPQTFIEAGSLGANVLTHLLGQTLSDLTEKIALYRQARADHGYDPDSGKVTLMLHTFIGMNAAEVRETVRGPFSDYLRTSVGLMAGLAKSLNLPFNLNDMTEAHMQTLLSVAFDRYYNTSALFGTPDSVQPLLDEIRASGIDEIACLVDFGVASDTVLAHLPYLGTVLQRVIPTTPEQDFSLITQAHRHQPTLFQCTPSLMRLALLNPATTPALQSLRVLMLGGEALPPALAEQCKATLPCRLVNMYGPTETTIWSATHEVEQIGTTIPLGMPIANTQLYVLDRHLQPTPIGVTGELYIGGDGVTHGYWQRAELTESRFVPDPFHPDNSRRLYRTGDLARWRADGTVEFLGRADFQIKLRGFRIELGEIEAVLVQYPLIQEAVVVAREDSPGDVRLVAYLVLTDTSSNGSLPQQLRDFLKSRLPEYMVPALFVTMPTFPLTANGKVDRNQLPKPEQATIPREYVAPRSQLERDIATIWRDALKLEQVSASANFFDLGGHSLLMAQVHQQLQQLVGRDVPLVKLLEYPTINALATYLSASGGQPSTATQGQTRAEQQIAARRARAGRGGR